MSVKPWVQQQKISAQNMIYHHCCYCYNSTWLRRVTVKRRQDYEIYFTMQWLVSSLFKFPFWHKTLMLSLQTFKIPPGALLITHFLHCWESPSLILGLTLHCDLFTPAGHPSLWSPCFFSALLIPYISHKLLSILHVPSFHFLSFFFCRGYQTQCV